MPGQPPVQPFHRRDLSLPSSGPSCTGAAPTSLWPGFTIQMERYNDLHSDSSQSGLFKGWLCSHSFCRNILPIFNKRGKAECCETFLLTAWLSTLMHTNKDKEREAAAFTFSWLKQFVIFCFFSGNTYLFFKLQNC